MSLPPQTLDWPTRPANLRGLRIGLLLEAGCGGPAAPEVRAAIERAARDFEAAGSRVEPLAPFLTQDMLDGLDRFWRMRSLDRHPRAAGGAARESAAFHPRLGRIGDRALGRSWFFTVSVKFSRCENLRSRRRSRSIIVISPTAPITAFAAELASPSDDPLNPFPHIGFTVAYNMSDQPAATINCGYSEAGLPIGLQIVGHRFDDVGVMAVAMAFEAMRAAEARPWPEPPGA